jgi:hypothetical protein
MTEKATELLSWAGAAKTTWQAIGKGVISFVRHFSTNV